MQQTRTFNDAVLEGLRSHRSVSKTTKYVKKEYCDSCDREMSEDDMCVHGHYCYECDSSY